MQHCDRCFQTLFSCRYNVTDSVREAIQALVTHVGSQERSIRCAAHSHAHVCFS